MTWTTRAREEADTGRPPAYRVNQYGGRCWRCQTWLEPGAGLAVPTAQTAAQGAQATFPWQVQHIGEVCPAQPPLRRVDDPSSAPPDVPAGRYAVDGEDGALKFYRVDRPDEGRWAGYTFVKVQAGSDLYPVRGPAARTILLKIAADPRAAMLRYGLELGHCGSCGAELTNPDSRARGIGPVCAAKYGW